MEEFRSSNLAQVCDNCGARHPDEKSCLKFWQWCAMGRLDQLVNKDAELARLKLEVEALEGAVDHYARLENWNGRELARAAKQRVEEIRKT